MPHKVKINLLDDVDASGIADGDILMWNDAVQKWMVVPEISDSGGGVTAHDDLTGVTSDQHHAEVHDVDGSDHTFPGDASTYLDGAGNFTTPGSSPGSVVSISTEALGHASTAAAPGSPDSTNDEFTDTSLASWTTSVPGTNPGTYVKRYGRLWYRHQNTSGSGNPNITALLKSRSMSTGDYIETCIHRVGTSNYTGLGLIMADGTSQGSGKQITAFIYNDAERLTLRGMNNFNADQGALQTEIITNYGLYPGSAVYVRLKYESANTFGLYWSPDGFEWKTVGTSSFTMTPSYVGVCTLFYGAVAAPGGWFNWHYFRTNPGNES